MRGLIVGIGRKYSKPLAPCCITAACHTATHTRMWRGCPTEVSIPHGEFFLALGFAYPLFYSVNAILPNSRTLDGYPPSKLVSNFLIIEGLSLWQSIPRAYLRPQQTSKLKTQKGGGRRTVKLLRC